MIATLAQNRLRVHVVSAVAVSRRLDLRSITRGKFGFEESTFRVVVRTLLLLLLVDHVALPITGHRGRLAAIFPVLFEVERLANVLIGRGLRVSVHSLAAFRRGDHLRLDDQSLHLIAAYV